MKNICVAFIMCVGLVTGCGRKIVPVSSITKTQTDSTTTKTNTQKDSIIYRERVIEKILPSATVGIGLTKRQLDSLTRALGNLPGKTLYYTDPTLRAQLQVVLDSLGNVTIKCTSLEKIYFERTTEQRTYIEKLERELSKVKSANSTDTISEVKPGLWQSIKKNFLMKLFGLLFILLIILAIINWMRNYIKRIRNKTL